jgi:hypothetical protein
MKLIKYTAAAVMMLAVTVASGQKLTKEQQAEKRLEAKQNANQARVEKVSMDNKDGYGGKKQAILKRLTVAEIPASFPKYTESTKKEDYKLMIRKWFRENKNLLKPEYQEKLK